MTKTIAISTMEKFDNRQKNTVGSSRIRARWLLNYWKEAEEYKMGKNYDVMIYQKVYWKKMMEKFDGIQILDICDPDWLEKKPVFEFVDLADATVTSSEPLAQYIQKIRPSAKVVCIPDRMYLPELTPVKSKHEGKIRSMVWFGYSQNTHYLQKTFDELLKNDIKLTIISNQPYTPPYAFQKLEVENIPYDYNTVNSELIKHDALLMPAPSDDIKGQYKSNNKVLIGWALGLPVVSTADELDAMMDAKVRKIESEKRLKEIREKWDVKISVQEYKQLIAEIREAKK